MNLLKSWWNRKSTAEEAQSVQARALRGLLCFLALMVCCTIVSRAADTMTVAAVSCEVPRREALVHRVTVDGILEAEERVPVLAAENTLVQSVAVLEGDEVKGGDLLFTCDTSELLRTLKQKQLELQQLQLELQTLKETEDYDSEMEDTAVKRAQEDYDLAADRAAADIAAASEELRRSRRALRNYGETVDEDDEDYDEDMDSEYYTLRERYREKKRLYDEAVLNKKEALAKAERALIDAQNQKPGDALQQKEIDCQLKQLEIAQVQAQIAAGGEVYSPADGVVGELLIAPGKRTTNEAALYLTGTGNLRFSAEIDAEQKKVIKRGDAIQLRLAGEEKRLEGLTVSAVKPVAGKSEVWKIIVSLPEGKGEAGLSAAAEVNQRSQPYDIVLPLSALYSDGPQNYVLVVRETETPLGLEQVAERIDVILEDSNESRAAVTGAVSRDNQVVTQSNKPLSAGDRVRVQSGEAL